jgi:hypothetical protein
VEDEGGLDLLSVLVDRKFFMNFSVVCTAVCARDSEGVVEN